LDPTAVSSDDALRASAKFLADRIVDDLQIHPDRYNDWLSAMHPARAHLVAPLTAIFRGRDQTGNARSVAATVLARFVREDADSLTSLLLDADVRQFPVILNELSRYQAEAIARLSQQIEASPPKEATAAEKLLFVSRQANAAIGLLQWG